MQPGTASAPAKRLQDPPAPENEKVKLLLVDDDRDNLLALQAVLDPLGEDLLLAGSGMDALRLCLEHDFAAILLDVRMPEMDGFETAELIRQRKRSRQTPILFLTAYRSDEQLFRGYDLGAVDFLFKPIVPEVLQSKVAVFVELSRSDQMLRRKTDALTRTEQKFRAVLETAPDAMIIADESGVITLANSRTDDLFGYSRAELTGLNVRMLIPEWTGSEAPQGSSRVIARRFDGSSFPAEITVRPFETDDGLLVTTAIRDDTAQVEAEERVRVVNAELERRVAERTLELTRSNDALRQFAWAASHDLQEPVRMVLAYSQWLKNSAGAKLDESESEMLDVVHGNADRMHNLLSALRDYIFVSESGQEARAPIDANEILRTVLATLSGTIAQAGAAVTSDPLPEVACAPVLLRQLFQNLIANSVKYRSAEPPRVHVRAERDGDGWTFSVRDNGIGIEPQYLDYVFGVFKRLYGTEYSGTGIGLAICKAAAERLGGRIWVDSQEGAGSTFFFTVPDRRPS